MDWLNYHHLRYFWTVAKAGGLRAAAEKLRVSPPSISAQVRELEESLGEKLFRRSGRSNVLTDAGQIALRFADEIFALGSELTNAIKQRPTAQELRLHVGVVDSLPKLVANDLLRPAFTVPQPVHIVCREGKIEDLLAQLAAHRLDLVLADEPAPSTMKIRAFSHLLGESDVTFCAVAPMAARLRRGFPRSLHGAPALLPAETTGMRRSLEKWFSDTGIRPRVIGEFEDAALMKVMASDGKGFVPLPDVVTAEAVARFGLRKIATTTKCRDQFFAITIERRIHHPAMAAITAMAQEPRVE
jgi:LysR family transcriptional activator of nhaA